MPTASYRPLCDTTDDIWLLQGYITAHKLLSRHSTVTSFCIVNGHEDPDVNSRISLCVVQRDNPGCSALSVSIINDQNCTSKRSISNTTIIQFNKLLIVVSKVFMVDVNLIDDN